MEGYIDIQVAGKTVNLYFGYSAYKAFINGAIQYREQFLTEEGGLTDFGFTHLLQTAYEAHCINHKIKPVVSFDDFCQWLDESTTTEEGKAILNKVLETWAQSKEVKKMIEDNEKKSLAKVSEMTPLMGTTSMPSNPSATANSGGDLLTSTG